MYMIFLLFIFWLDFAEWFGFFGGEGVCSKVVAWEIESFIGVVE